MDKDKLISLVYENVCLWDMSDKNYHNRDICQQKWEKVATELNTTSKYDFFFILHFIYHTLFITFIHHYCIATEFRLLD